MILTKLTEPSQIVEFTELLHQQGKKIVFTNGCFDIVHAGHVLYLESAKNLGDVLIVGVNSDASVQRLKGDSRPIMPQEERTVFLGALESVDYVVIFDEDTPYELIKQIKPNILVKGGDWAVDEIVGADLVLDYGGTVKSLSFREGISSSEIIQRIRQSE